MFSGSMPALVTPFDANHDVDEAAFSKHIDWVIREGSNGVVPVGTTGESATLSHDEHNRVVEICIEQTDGRVPVIAGAGSNNTIEAIELSLHAEKCGADGLLVVTPYYNRPTQAGLYQHFKLIAQATKLPILVYNIPGRCAVDMSVDTMAALTKDFSNIVGVKDATADMVRVTQTRAACGPDFCQMSAEDASALGFYAHGGVGCISVTTNVAPKLCSQFQVALAAGDFPKALELQDLLMPLHDAIFAEPGVAGVKYALSKMGRMENTLRSPMLPVTPETAKKIDLALKHVGIEA
ncbi:4-hydroxy-tetrahydrodipicolinate synthase [Lentilitoribacter sp. Alg239-R112]|uniref:4-hydroxy-tetrahydrodipicolinate synthase n=1 Tax=Lentilitoribacter sp. Alg239-R112 TaxID=2305987 RepID=UPI0013A6AC79|nr:4-hydroxy-tetrahydrodipicolinate synthase [Lentilitoribacter sp. Alg239-R112]